MQNLLNKFITGYYTTYATEKTIMKVVRTTKSYLIAKQCDTYGNLLEKDREFKFKRSPYHVAEVFCGVGADNFLGGFEVK